MDVKAVYKLPVPIWIMSDSFDQTISTGCRGVSFDVCMPSADSPSDFVNPSFRSPAALNHQSVLTPWATRYAAMVEDQFEPALAIDRIGLENVVGHFRDERTWAGADHQLTEVIGIWFDEVRTWVEVLTGQDLDPNHRLYSAVDLGADLSFIEPSHEGPVGLRLTTEVVRPVTNSEWRVILDKVNQAARPPLEHILLRDANNAYRRVDFRRSLVDTGTALEIVLKRALEQWEVRNPSYNGKPIKSIRMLGKILEKIDELQIEVGASVDRLRTVVDLRNDAVHEGKEPSSLCAASAISIVRNVVHEIDATGQVEGGFAV